MFNKGIRILVGLPSSSDQFSRTATLSAIFHSFEYIWVQHKHNKEQKSIRFETVGAELYAGISSPGCMRWWSIHSYGLTAVYIHNIFLWKIEKWKSNKNSPFYGINFLEKKYDIFAEGIKGTRSKKNCFKNNIYCYLTQKGKESKNIICKDFIWKRNGLNGKFTYPRMNVRMSEYSSFVVEWLWIIFFLSIRRMKKELE